MGMGSLVRVGSFSGKVILSTSSINQYSGVQMWEANGFTRWIFCNIGGATVTTVTVYGTIDGAALIMGVSGTPYGPNPTYPAPLVAGGNWFALNSGPVAASPADVVNPFTKGDGSQYLIVNSYPLVAICATTGGTQTGTSTLLAYASQ